MKKICLPIKQFVEEFSISERYCEYSYFSTLVPPSTVA